MIQLVLISRIMCRKSLEVQYQEENGTELQRKTASPSIGIMPFA